MTQRGGRLPFFATVWQFELGTAVPVWLPVVWFRAENCCAILETGLCKFWYRAIGGKSICSASECDPGLTSACVPESSFLFRFVLSISSGVLLENLASFAPHGEHVRLSIECQDRNAARSRKVRDGEKQQSAISLSFSGAI